MFSLRQHNELWEKLQHVGLERSAPTIVLAECVLVYMDLARCDDLLSSLAQQFENCVFINYEQVCINQYLIHCYLLLSLG